MKNTRHLNKFFILTFLFSYLVWAGLIFLELPDSWFLPLLILGAFGPSLTAMGLVHWYGDKKECKDFWNRVIDPRRIGLKWFLVILLLFPAILLTGYFIYALVGGNIPSLASFFAGMETPETFIMLMLIMVFAGPVSEELGWRGYALEPLQKKWGDFKGSILLGLIWIVWHLPLFFIAGTSQASKGFGFSFWAWSFQVISLSVIFTWIFNKTNKSILGAILLHLCANFFYPSALDPQGELVFAVIRFAIVMGIVGAWLRSSNGNYLILRKEVN
jgi:uncharacterized protein